MTRRKKTILLVDDEEDYRELTAELLEHHGFRVVTATDGASAVAALSRGPRPDLVILDLKMPRTDGWGVFGWMRARKTLEGVPVIIVSGIHLADDLAARINQGAPLWLRKPVEPAELLAAIERHC